MIQDRIEKLGRDVFYDMLSSGREPLHALCVLKVNMRTPWNFIIISAFLLTGRLQVLLGHAGQGQQPQFQPLRGVSAGQRGLHQGQVLRERPVHGGDQHHWPG